MSYWLEASLRATGCLRKFTSASLRSVSTSSALRSMCTLAVLLQNHICLAEQCSSNKAVSDGAISFHLDHLVKSRVSKMAYGTFRHIEFDPSDPEHVARRHKSVVMPSGRAVLPDSFAVILPRVRIPCWNWYRSLLNHLVTEYPSI